MRLYGLLEGQVCICVQSMWQTRGVRGHTPPGNVDFGPFVRCYLVKSGTIFTQTIHCASAYPRQRGVGRTRSESHVM